MPKLCLCTFNSPKLLMLSGIGPQQHLEELEIPVLQDLPVGQNLHDHITYPGLAFIIDKPYSTLVSTVLTRDSLNDFFTNGTGPVTSLGGAEGIGYIKTKESKETDPLPDIELLFTGGTLASDYGLVTRRGMRISNYVYNRLLAPIHDKHAWSIFPMLLHPKSIGYLKLRSNNPYDAPLLYGNYLTDPENQDINTFVAAIRVIQRLAKTEAFKKLNTRLNPNPIPTCRFYKYDSDEYWKCALRSIAVTLHHQVGTSKMGPPNDPRSVVNYELKVYGINRLRVADCSVIPFAIGAHTNAPAMMVGEKAADMIKRTWQRL